MPDHVATAATAEYIAREVEALSEMARGVGMMTTAYLLSMAQLDAVRLVTGGARTAPRKRAKARAA